MLTNIVLISFEDQAFGGSNPDVEILDIRDLVAFYFDVVVSACRSIATFLRRGVHRDASGLTVLMVLLSIVTSLLLPDSNHHHSGLTLMASPQDPSI